MEEGKKTKKGSSLTASFRAGAVALVFLVIGYQTALFLHRAAVLRIAAHRDHPDTVYVMDRALAGEVLGSLSEAEREALAAGLPEPSGGRASVQDPAGTASSGGWESAGTASSGSGAVTVRKSSVHPPLQTASRAARRTVESFRFDPNTVSVADLQRLGFSERQAEAIDHYRAKGGRFRRPADFARSYVVADSVYERLAPYIDIPKLDINRADSAAFETLPGIGKWFASRLVAYRAELGGYSCPEQLMDIRNFDAEKYDGLKDLITCSRPAPYPLWTLPEAELARHPYISKAEAHGIVLYREHHAPEACTLDGLRAAGALSADHHRLLSRCVIAAP